jgi:hypothetical protein
MRTPLRQPATTKSANLLVETPTLRNQILNSRRLQVRYERRADILTGFGYLACALICLKHHE